MIINKSRQPNCQQGDSRSLAPSNSPQPALVYAMGRFYSDANQPQQHSPTIEQDMDVDGNQSGFQRQQTNGGEPGQRFHTQQSRPQLGHRLSLGAQYPAQSHGRQDYAAQAGQFANGHPHYQHQPHSPRGSACGPSNPTPYGAFNPTLPQRHNSVDSRSVFGFENPEVGVFDWDSNQLPPDNSIEDMLLRNQGVQQYDRNEQQHAQRRVQKSKSVHNIPTFGKIPDIGSYWMDGFQPAEAAFHQFQPLLADSYQDYQYMANGQGQPHRPSVQAKKKRTREQPNHEWQPYAPPAGLENGVHSTGNGYLVRQPGGYPQADHPFNGMNGAQLQQALGMEYMSMGQIGGSSYLGPVQPYSGESIPLADPSNFANFPTLTLAAGKNRGRHQRAQSVSAYPHSVYSYGKQAPETPKKICTNCGTTSTPSWRRDSAGKNLLCNACGLYSKLHNRPRPFKVMNDGTVKVHRPAAIEENICANCMTNDTPLWRRSSDGSVLCNACGLYYKQHGKLKPDKLEDGSDDLHSSMEEPQAFGMDNMGLDGSVAPISATNGPNRYAQSAPKSPSLSPLCATLADAPQGIPRGGRHQRHLSKSSLDDAFLMAIGIAADRGENPVGAGTNEMHESVSGLMSEMGGSKTAKQSMESNGLLDLQPGAGEYIPSANDRSLVFTVKPTTAVRSDSHE